MAESKRAEIGFGAGQVITVRVDEKQLEELMRVVQRREGWYELDTQDGKVALDLRQVAFVRPPIGEHRVGFVGE